MSGQAELAHRFSRLEEISGIMSAMKNLSLVETHKLARFIEHQRRMLANIDEAAADFLHFYRAPPEARQARIILLLVGAERGFCGNFNARLLSALQDLPAWPQPPALVAIGQRLSARMTDKLTPGVSAEVAGATVSEEVPAVLEALSNTLDTLRASTPGQDFALFCLAHNAEGDVRLKRLLPLPAYPRPRHADAPQLQLPKADFLRALLDQYLLANLQGILYESLAAESRQRLAHMEQAIDRLDETLAELALRRNAMRQEQIIEEIEIMLARTPLAGV
jgi:F-type H+-transporting ATPase subunit gamma